MSEKPCGYRHLTDKQLEYQISKVSVKCLLHLIWNGHLTYRSDGVHFLLEPIYLLMNHKRRFIRKTFDIVAIYFDSIVSRGLHFFNFSMMILKLLIEK